MDVVKFIKESKRLCAFFEDCGGCPLFEKHLGCIIKPHVKADCEKIENIVKKWSAENPKKTRQSEFLKMFPNANIDVNGALVIAPCHVNTKFESEICGVGKCENCKKKYWLAEVDVANTNLINREEVIKVIDKHTNEDGALDEDISVILEEIS